ncbi:unnamed protein product [Knipowitschia caucasica]
MSMLLYVMVLVYLYGIQANNMEHNSSSSKRQQQEQPQQPSPDPLNALIIQLLQADLTRVKSKPQQNEQGRDPEMPDVPDMLPPLPPNLPLVSADEQWDDVMDQNVMMVHSDLLRQHKRYHSPRVLLSDRLPLQPPPLYISDDFASGTSEGGNRTRKKRYAEHRSYRGEYSVCDSQSRWVTDRTEAVDDRGSLVTVLAKIRTNAREDIKQYFYETRCQSPRPSKGGCRGIDSKNWNSQCKTTQTFVRALTQVRNAVGWRWIRIDTSCVCALSRKRRRT